MRPKIFLCLAAVAAIVTFQPSVAHSQGSLAPQGPPAPSMKSLDQVEPRTIVNSINTPGDAYNEFIISQPGSYYLTTNLFVTGSTNGIEIITGNVTLDLNGFTLAGLASASSGIVIIADNGGATNVKIRNGAVSSWGEYGIIGGDNLTIEKVTVSGCANSGVYMGANCIVTDCQLLRNDGGDSLYGGFGLEGGENCTVRGCLFSGNQNTGAELGDDFNVCNCTASFNGEGFLLSGDGLIRDCVANHNTNAYQYGIRVAGGVHIERCIANYNWYGIYVEGDGGQLCDCIANSNTYSGIIVNGDGLQIRQCVGKGNQNGSCISLGGNFSQIRDCVATFNVGSVVGGIYVYGDACEVRDCVASSNSPAGIGIIGARNTVAGCVTMGNPTGILVEGDSIVADNHSSANYGDGINTSGVGSRIEHNQIRDNNGFGVNSTGGSGADVIIRNTARNNAGGNYSPSTGPTFAPVQTPATATSPWANF